MSKPESLFATAAAKNQDQRQYPAKALIMVAFIFAMIIAAAAKQQDDRQQAISTPEEIHIFRLLIRKILS